MVYNAIGFNTTRYMLICGILFSRGIDLNHSKKYH